MNYLEHVCLGVCLAKTAIAYLNYFRSKIDIMRVKITACQQLSIIN